MKNVFGAWSASSSSPSLLSLCRIGQVRPVQVVRLTMKHSVEEKIVQLQDKKRDMARTALGDASDQERIGLGAQGAETLTKEDLYTLLDIRKDE